MERLVIVKFGTGRRIPYKTFFNVNLGDYVVVKSLVNPKGFSVVQIVSVDVPHSIGVRMEELDYLVQPINPLAYEHYKEKDANLRKAKEIIRGLSADELEELAQIIVQRYPGN